ncbi:MAG: hypothetical protein WKF43_11460 [Acidimicrobiales bacterium]
MVGPTGPAVAATTTNFVTEIQDGFPPDQSDPSDKNWYRDDTRVGGGATFTTEWGGPPGFGPSALALTTNYRSTAKAQVMNHGVVGTPLADVTG